MVFHDVGYALYCMRYEICGAGKQVTFNGNLLYYRQVSFSGTFIQFTSNTKYHLYILFLISYICFVVCFLHFRLLGSIPGPVLFGFIIDQACVLSTTSGNCLIYDNFSMSIYMMIASLISKCLGLLFISLTLISSRWCQIKEVK